LQNISPALASFSAAFSCRFFLAAAHDGDDDRNGDRGPCGLRSPPPPPPWHGGSTTLDFLQWLGRTPAAATR
jgi:hypothetical protein